MLFEGIVLFILALFCYGWWIEPEWYKTQKYMVSAPSLKVPYSLILVTDLHIGRFGTSAHYNRLAQKIGASVKQSNAQTILIGGDFIDYHAKYLPRLLTLIAELKTFGVPLYGVLGNHDYISFKDPEVLIEALVDAGCRVLRNQVEVIDNAFLLIGVDDVEQAPNYPSQSHYVSLTDFEKPLRYLNWEQQFSSIAPDLPRVLLSHNPDGTWLPGIKPLITLSGHTHGGQTFFVDWIARFLRKPFFWLLPHGTFRSLAGKQCANSNDVIISRGVGGSAVPFRLGRRPELVVVTLTQDV